MPEHWLRTDLPALPLLRGGGDERACASGVARFLRQIRATTTQELADRRAYGSCLGLPAAADAKADASPHELIWSTPATGSRGEPLPTIQLKWLRRAQQDYEYLWLAADRDERVHALWLARLITKPVEIEANKVPDPAYTLMSGTTDEAAWPKALNLLAKAILLHPQPDASGNAPGTGTAAVVNTAKRDELDIETLQWVAPQERPMLLGRQALWTWEIAPNQPGGNWLYLRVGLDLTRVGRAAGAE